MRAKTALSMLTIALGLYLFVGDVTGQARVQNLAQDLVRGDYADTRWSLASLLLNAGYPARCVTDLLVDLSTAHQTVSAMTATCARGDGFANTCDFRSEGEAEGRVGLGLHRLESCRRLTAESAILPLIRWPTAASSLRD